MNVVRERWALTLGYIFENDAWGLQVYWGKNPDKTPGYCRYLHGVRFAIGRGRLRLPPVYMSRF